MWCRNMMTTRQRNVTHRWATAIYQMCPSVAAAHTDHGRTQIQNWLDAGPASLTLARHRASTGPALSSTAVRHRRAARGWVGNLLPFVVAQMRHQIALMAPAGINITYPASTSRKASRQMGRLCKRFHNAMLKGRCQMQNALWSAMVHVNETNNNDAAEKNAYKKCVFSTAKSIFNNNVLPINKRSDKVSAQLKLWWTN